MLKGLVLVCIAVCLPAAGARSEPGAPLAPNVVGSVGFRTGPLLARGIRVLTRATWWGGSYTASTGDPVRIYISDSYPRDDSVAQRWANLFGSLLHGPELGLLTAYVAPLAEVQETCGGDRVLGCYGGERLVTIGEPEYGMSPEAVAMHEYGHHVAANRTNPPWNSLDWGSKRWASYENVCSRTIAGTAFPGDEDLHYMFNPGEAFAETYRVLNEVRAGAPGFTWPIADASFRPDAAALAQVEQDVLNPWTKAVEKTTLGSFARATSRVWALTIATPLDGDVAADVHLPVGGGYDVTLQGADGSTLARALWSGTRQKSLQYRICGRRTVVLRVVRVGTGGTFVVRTRVP